MFCVSGKEISEKLHHAPSTRHWTSTHLETLVYTVTWSFDITFHQSPVYMIEHDVSELYCNPPMSTNISYRWQNLNCFLYCNLITVAAFSLKTVLTLSSSLNKHQPKNVGNPGAIMRLQRQEHASIWAKQNRLHMTSVPDEDDQSQV